MNLFSSTMTWPEPGSIAVGRDGYRTPEGTFPRVTSILKTLGLGTDALIAWSAGLERESVLQAVADVYASGSFPDSPDDFRRAVETHIGPAKAHIKKLKEASDVGTAAHEMVQWTLRTELGEKAGVKPVLTDASEMAFMGWSDWWKSSGLKPVRIEQPVWHSAMGYAGTVDLIAQGPDGLELLDWKTSRGIYETYHLQVAAYAHAARQWAPIGRCRIVRLPKNYDDPAFEVRELGDMTYDYVKAGKRVAGGRKLSEAECLQAFVATLDVHHVLKGRPS